MSLYPHLVEGSEFREGTVTTLCGQTFAGYLWDEVEGRPEATICKKCLAKRIAGRKYSSLAIEAQRVRGDEQRA